MNQEPEVWREQRLCRNCGKPEHFGSAYCKPDLTTLERAQAKRIDELERRLAEMERLYDKAAADLIEALDVTSAYRATASTLHQDIERRNGVERRIAIDPDRAEIHGWRRGGPAERRKSWPR